MKTEHRVTLIIKDDHDWKMIEQATASMDVSRSAFFRRAGIIAARLYFKGVNLQALYDNINTIVHICSTPKLRLFFELFSAAEKKGVTIHHLCANLDKIVDVCMKSC